METSHTHNASHIHNATCFEYVNLDEYVYLNHKADFIGKLSGTQILPNCTAQPKNLSANYPLEMGTEGTVPHYTEVAKVDVACIALYCQRIFQTEGRGEFNQNSALRYPACL